MNNVWGKQNLKRYRINDFNTRTIVVEQANSISPLHKIRNFEKSQIG